MAHFRMLLSDDLLSEVDQVRGDVPRVAWVRRACEHYLDARYEEEFARSRGDSATAGRRGDAPQTSAPSSI